MSLSQFECKCGLWHSNDAIEQISAELDKVDVSHLVEMAGRYGAAKEWIAFTEHHFPEYLDDLLKQLILE